MCGVSGAVAASYYWTLQKQEDRYGYHNSGLFGGDGGSSLRFDGNMLSVFASCNGLAVLHYQRDTLITGLLMQTMMDARSLDAPRGSIKDYLNSIWK